MLPASAFASALLDWWTLPSSPGLRTRIPTAVLLGLSCRATAAASADWPLALSWPATCVPEPPCDWSIDLAGEVAVAGQRVCVCAVGLADVAVVAGAQHPDPDSRVARLVLCGDGEGACVLPVLVRLACDLGAGLAATGRGGNGAAVPPWDWSIVWPVRLMLPASAFASALLDWWTLPSSPGLRTRIPTAVLLGLSCRATAAASADWPLELSWPATCVPEPPCDWSIDWPVRLPLPASAFASALLDWPTLPSSPGLRHPDPDSRVARLVLRGDGEGACVLPVLVRLACDLGAGLAATGRGQRRSGPALGLVDRLAGEVDVAGQCVCVCAVGLVDVAVVAGAEDADPDGGVARLVLQGDRGGVGRLAARVVLARDLRARPALRLVDRLAGEVAVAGQRVCVCAVGLADVAVVTRAQHPDPDSRVARRGLAGAREGACGLTARVSCPAACPG